MGDIFNILLLQNTLRIATPVVLAAMGCLMTQHVNITNIGIDGMMLIGAFFAVLGSYYLGSWAAGVGVALLLGVLLLDPAAFIAQANALLALQVSMLLSRLALPLLIASMSALVIGFMLIALHQKRMRQLIVRSIAA